MKQIKLIKESEISAFLRAGTVQDVEVYLNSKILVRKHIDMDKGDANKEYIIKLVDKASINGEHYRVASNSVGLEALRVISKRHKITNGGSESENSVLITFYCK